MDYQNLIFQKEKEVGGPNRGLLFFLFAILTDYIMENNKQVLFIKGGYYYGRINDKKTYGAV